MLCSTVSSAVSVKIALLWMRFVTWCATFPSQRELGQYSYLISWNIKKAFNSARRKEDLFILLEKYRVPLDLLGLIDSFLWIRSVISNTNERYFNVGLPQGSCLGLIFWLLSINSLLKQLGIHESWSILVFAHDIFILAYIVAVYWLLDIFWRILVKNHAWATELDGWTT